MILIIPWNIFYIHKCISDFDIFIFHPGGNLFLNPGLAGEPVGGGGAIGGGGAGGGKEIFSHLHMFRMR